MNLFRGGAKRNKFSFHRSGDGDNCGRLSEHPGIIFGMFRQYLIDAGVVAVKVNDEGKVKLATCFH